MRIQNKLAFTLAEVLITLAIIGVVAAMTIPTLISNYEEKATVTKVKQFYAMLNQTLMLAVVENGDISSWNYSEVSDFAKYIKPHLKVVRDCGTSSGCLADVTYNYLNGTQKGGANYDSNDDYYKMVLANGSHMWFETDNVSDVKVQFFYDVNGKNGPNAWGKDLFNFLLYDNSNKLVPEFADDCYLDSYGYGCAQFVLTNGHMNYPATQPIVEE